MRIKNQYPENNIQIYNSESCAYTGFVTSNIVTKNERKGTQGQKKILGVLYKHEN